MSRYIVQHRRGTAAQWAEKNTIIPMAGELVIEIDEENAQHKLKIGDGIHTYAELAYLQAGDEVITQALAKALPRVVTITLDVDQWSEVTCETDPKLGYYGQAITLDGITERSRLDLQPSADMLAEFQDLNLVFVTENKNGAITVYSVGDMPLKTYTMQATIVETELVVESDKVVGIPIGTPTTKADWSQTDESKADYIKNKPDTLPNPNKLTFTGAVEGEYDGSEAITLNIPVVSGSDGEDGISPIATVEQTESGAVITITDVNGTTTATVLNGTDGQSGKSAYQYAQDGGYTGTEEEFARSLSGIDDIEIPVTSVNNKIGDVLLSADDVGAIAYMAQNLTEEQKAQARSNIGAGDSTFSGSYNDLTERPEIPSIDGLASEDYVSQQVSGKVDKIEGKGLSTNDFTDKEKEKLAGLTVEVGEGENSLIANDVAEDSESRNIATSKNSSAFGTGSRAGSKGFKLATLTKDVDANTATYGIAHKSTEDDIIDEQLAELQTILGGGTEILVSIMYNSNFDLCGKITKIEVRKESLMSYITIDNIPQQSDGSAQDLIPNADPLSATNTLRLYQYPQFGTIDVGNGAFASGGGQALAPYAHAEGYSKAIGKFSHAEGRSTLAVWGSHSEGQYTKALNLSSHAEGQHTQALGESSHAEGDHTVAESAVSHAEGSHTRTAGGAAHAEGYYTEAIGEFSHAEGDHTNAEGGTSHAEGYYTTSSGAYSHSEGEKSTASGKDSHAEGANTTASAYAAHAEGSNTSASGAASHTEGTGTQATVTAAHAEGTSTTASHDSAHAEGYNTTASGQYSHAEGHTTQATKTASHAEGHATIASNTRAHAEGGPNTVASGESSHAEGYSCKATARASHAGGYATTADSEAQTTIGKFNKIGTGALFVVGNGTSESNRTNVFEVYNDRTEVKTAPTNLGCVRNIWVGTADPSSGVGNDGDIYIQYEE
jgi:hypothetical protein